MRALIAALSTWSFGGLLLPVIAAIILCYAPLFLVGSTNVWLALGSGTGRSGSFVLQSGHWRQAQRMTAFRPELPFKWALR